MTNLIGYVNMNLSQIKKRTLRDITLEELQSEYMVLYNAQKKNSGELSDDKVREMALMQMEVKYTGGFIY